MPQLLADAAVTPALAVFALGLLALELGAGLEGLVGTVVQEGDDGSQLVQDVEDVAAPGDVGQGQRLPGLETAAGVTDDGLRREAVRLQLQQADAPGDGVALLLQAQQVAERGADIDADQHRLVRLEDLVVGADADGRQVVLLVEGLGPGHGGAGDTVQVAQRPRAVEQVAEQLVDAAVGAVAHQEQGQDESLEPDRGYRQVEQDGVVRRDGGERVGEGVLGLVGLLVDERAADLIVLRQLGDGPGSGQGLEGQLLPLVGAQELGGTGRGGRGRGDWGHGAG